MPWSVGRKMARRSSPTASASQAWKMSSRTSLSHNHWSHEVPQVSREPVFRRAHYLQLWSSRWPHRRRHTTTTRVLQRHIPKAFESCGRPSWSQATQTNQPMRKNHVFQIEYAGKAVTLVDSYSDAASKVRELVGKGDPSYSYPLIHVWKSPIMFANGKRPDKSWVWREFLMVKHIYEN